jgi:hypothetical protein
MVKLILVLVTLAAMSGAVANGGTVPPPELVWSNNQVYKAVFTTGLNETPTSSNAKPFYITAPQHRTNPQESAKASGCAHDHVVPLLRGKFLVEFNLLTAVASDRVATRKCAFFGQKVELAYAADLDGDPATAFQPLTSTARVKKARANGLVQPVYTGFSTTVTVKTAK